MCSTDFRWNFDSFTKTSFLCGEHCLRHLWCWGRGVKKYLSIVLKSRDVAMCWKSVGTLQHVSIFYLARVQTQACEMTALCRFIILGNGKETSIHSYILATVCSQWSVRVFHWAGARSELPKEGAADIFLGTRCLAITIALACSWHMSHHVSCLVLDYVCLHVWVVVTFTFLYIGS